LRSCSDLTDDQLTVIGLFSHFFGIETNSEERKFFKRLAILIGTRAARLSACGIAAIVSKCGYLESGGCGVATDGSLYKQYPHFPERIQSALVDIFGEKGKLIETYHAEDGSGVGAAIIAAMSKERLEKGEITHV
jgi:hexokinase